MDDREQDVQVPEQTSAGIEQEALQAPVTPVVEQEKSSELSAISATNKSLGAEKPRKSKKWLWIVLIALLIAILGAVIVLVILKPWEQVVEIEVSETEIVENNDATEESEESQAYILEEDMAIAEKIDVTSDLVKKVYGRINIGMSPSTGVNHTRFWTDLLWTGGDDKTVLWIAFMNTPRTPCKVTGRRVGPNGEGEQSGMCKNGATIRQQMREIFGREVPILDGTRMSPMVDTYDVQADEFWSFDAGFGGGPTPMVVTELYDAEISGDKLYVYEYAATYCVLKVGVTIGGEGYEGCRQIIDPQTESHVVWWFQIASTDPQDAFGGVMGERIMEIPIIGPYVEVDVNGNYHGEWWNEVGAVKLSDYAQVVGRYKWTFRDDSTGNYVFVSLERI